MLQEMLCKIEQLISDEYESIRQKGSVHYEIENIYRQIRFESPELAFHIKTRMLQFAKEKGDLH